MRVGARPGAVRRLAVSEEVAVATRRTASLRLGASAGLAVSLWLRRRAWSWDVPVEVPVAVRAVVGATALRRA